jgi:DNA-binding NarL/FixJ family response regulator
MRVGLQSMLEMDPHFEVVAEAADLSETGLLSRPADLIVLASWNISSADLYNMLQDINPTIPLLLLAEEPLSLQLLNRLNNRTWGVLPIDAAQDELLVSVRALSAGLWVGAPQMITKLFSQATPSLSNQDQEESDPLTPRESEILQYVAQGLTNKQVAWKLSISEHTVKFHISSIYSKLGAANRTEAVRLGARQGIILL